jgi:hypothetical protein
MDFLFKSVKSGERMASERILDARLQEPNALFEGFLLQAADWRSASSNQRMAMTDYDVRGDVLIAIAVSCTY